MGAKTYDAGVVVINAAKNGTIAPEVLEDGRRGRRNLSDIDRIMLAEHRREIVARKAKANLNHKVAGKKGNSPLANLPKVNTRDELAKAAGVGVTFLATCKNSKPAKTLEILPNCRPHGAMPFHKIRLFTYNSNCKSFCKTTTK
ncbi:MAG: hypothetical protein EXS16_19635 [Gemmataceae bacterium]|nr:hypothetical protein [Gemmataceae bacterium]